MSLFICSLQGAGETHEGKGYTCTVWAAYLVCNLMWPGARLAGSGNLDKGYLAGAGLQWAGKRCKKLQDVVKELPGLGYYLYP